MKATDRATNYESLFQTKKNNLGKKFSVKPLSIILSGLIFITANQALAQAEEAAPEEKDVDVNEILESEPTSAGGKRSPQVQELLVTGIKEEETKNLLKTREEPFSQSIISGEVLNRELGLDYESISKRLANVTFNQNNTRGASLSIRGVGKRAFAEVQDPSVLVIQDGVSFGLTAQGNFDFYDIETVEGFRGPVGTLGGKGGSSGAVYVTTKKPTFEPGGELSVAYGERDTVILKGAYGGPVIDDLLAWRGSFIVDKQRGAYEQRYDENFSMYNRNRVSGRVQFLLTPTEKFNALLSVDLEPRGAQLQNGLTFYVDQPERYNNASALAPNGRLSDPSGTGSKAKLAGFWQESLTRDPATNAITKITESWVGPRNWFENRKFVKNNVYSYEDYLANEGDETVYFNENQGQTVSNKGASLNLDYQLDHHKLNSITAWRAYTFDAHNDEGTPFDISIDGGGGVFYKQYSQEFSIESDKEGSFDYIAGLFFFQTEDTITSKTGWGSDAGAWFATTAQYNSLERNAGINRGAGLALLRDALDNVRKYGATDVETESNAIYGNANWHWHESATFTAGLRVGTEDRTTTDIVELQNDGSGSWLNPSSVRGIDLGGFDVVGTASTIPAELRGQLGTITQQRDKFGNAISATTVHTNANTDAQKSLADAVANKYYGVAITNVPGAAYNSLTAAQKAQIANAKALRASQIGQLIPEVSSTYDDTLYTGFLSQAYEFNDQVRGYVTWQYGEKSGTAFNINGEPTGVKPEKTNSYEVGVKTTFFDDELVFNINLFRMDIEDYQQAIRKVDEWATQDNINNGVVPSLAYITAQGNVDGVRVEGVEFDGYYTGIEHFSFRLSGAFNDAYYTDFKNSPKPPELNYLDDPFVDQTGKNLPGAAKWTVNLGVEYRLPVLSAAEFHASFNTAYTSDYLNADDLSSYSYTPGYSRTDASIGFGSIDGKLDVSLIVKNAFDDRTHERGWNSYAPWPYPRWVGVVFTGKF
ncbi:TonB-dependent receptor [Cellvibrio mixtus]|uniref:TonB-dependent receptor n=1 Tax=Cellvibrio mixtus TaxID=39650 RepID=UPI000694D892|nr:TonB-dependent receptor [Cellvibrio mixtus]